MLETPLQQMFRRHFPGGRTIGMNGGYIGIQVGQFGRDNNGFFHADDFFGIMGIRHQDNPVRLVVFNPGQGALFSGKGFVGSDRFPVDPPGAEKAAILRDPGQKSPGGGKGNIDEQYNSSYIRHIQYSIRIE